MYVVHSNKDFSLSIHLNSSTTSLFSIQTKWTSKQTWCLKYKYYTPKIIYLSNNDSNVALDMISLSKTWKEVCMIHKLHSKQHFCPILWSRCLVMLKKNALSTGTLDPSIGIFDFLRVICLIDYCIVVNFVCDNESILSLIQRDQCIWGFWIHYLLQKIRT